MPEWEELFYDAVSAGSEETLSYALQQMVPWLRDLAASQFNGVPRATLSEVDDVVSEFCIRVMSAFRSYNASLGKARPWLATIFINTSNTWKRKERRHKSVFRYFIQWKRPAAVSNEVMPEYRSSNEDRETLLCVALRKIPKDMEQIIRLRYWTDLTWNEIAEAVQLSEKTVRLKCRDGFKQLAAMLRDKVDIP